MKDWPGHIIFLMIEAAYIDFNRLALRTHAKMAASLCKMIIKI